MEVKATVKIESVNRDGSGVTFTGRVVVAPFKSSIHRYGIM